MIEDIVMMEYLKRKGIIPKEHVITMEPETPKHVPEEKISPDIYTEFFDSFKKVTKEMNKDEKVLFVERLKEFDNKPVEHFNESFARYTVSNMWHYMPDGNKCMGEVFDMLRAKEVYERHKHKMLPSVTYSDVYVAINAQYHDYCKLYKVWFGEDIDAHIIESAMTFWFEDDDANPAKLWNYFKER